MKRLKTFQKEELVTFIHARKGSLRLGKTIETIQDDNDWTTQLQQSLARYVLVGLPENIGLRAVDIHLQTIPAFTNFVRQFVNLQDNLYLTGEDCLLLGTVNFEDLLTKLKFLHIDHNEMYELVEQIDERVYNIAKIIFEAGKTPIFIGGGQNNAYPILKALSETKQSSVNALNVSAHTGLQPPDNRHARNGFSYALLDEYLHKYYAFGLHESEIPHSIYEFILANYSQIGFTRFEAILQNDPYLFEAIEEAKEFLAEKPTGIEVNMNCMSDITLSPDYPDGFLLREVRQIIRKFAHQETITYLHLCETQSNPTIDNNEMIAGKSLALLVADFIKASTFNEEEEEE